jgi:hypothetical protein
MTGYTKEFLISAFVSRYESLGLEAVEQQQRLAEACWNMYSKEKFRQYCSLDADAIKQYKQKLKEQQ